jgi:transposase
MPSPKPFVFTQEQRQEIESILGRGTTEIRLHTRAEIIHRLMDGQSAYRVATDMHLTFNTVYKWQSRFLADGVSALRDASRPGQPRRITEEETVKVLEMTMHALPAEATHWSLRLMSLHTGVSRYRVETIWKAANLKPHLCSTFNFSSDPNFAEKVIDIVGLYMNPPDDAIVLSVDEKTQIQALDHTQPLLQLRPGQIERHTHDYVRNGTTNLYAAFDIMTGRVIGNTAERHRASEFISFLNLVDRRMKARRNHDRVHVILDNSSTHKTAEVKEWMGKHPQYSFHFTPTSSSWLNAVEGWFSRLERFGLRGKAFKSVKQLREHLRQHIVQFNRCSAKPFVWVKDADTIIASVARARAARENQTERRTDILMN